MNRQTLLKHLVWLMFFIFIVNSTGEFLHWDTLLWYFDIVMHSLGGVWVGMFFVYVFSKYEASRARLFLQVLLATTAMGIFWEFYQYYIYVIVSRTPFDFHDTSIDVLCDLAGAIFAGSYFIRRIMPAKTNKVKSE